MEPEISLILSVYNQRRWGDLVLSSALTQSISVPYEIIICDDGSSDNLFEFMRQLSVSSEVDLRYIWQPDRGFRLSRSRNNAIRMAQGKILVFADGDTWLSPDFLKDHWNAHSEPSLLVCGLRWTCVVSHAPDERFSVENLRQEVSRQSGEDQLEHRFQRKWLGSDRPWMSCLGGNFSVPRSSHLYFDESFEGWGSEDRDVAYRLFQAGFRPHLLARPNASQIRTSSGGFKSMDSTQIAGFLRNKLILRAKYPGGEMTPSLSIVRFCHFDEASNRWSIGAAREDASPDEILDAFELWYENR